VPAREPRCHCGLLRVESSSPVSDDETASSVATFGRFALAHEIASGALFLASDESSYVTSSTFLVDGGISQAYLTPDASDDPQY